MSDRCDCPYPDPMTYGGPNPLCPEHGDRPDREGRHMSWDELIKYNRRWVEAHKGNTFQHEAARRMAVLLDAMEALLSDESVERAARALYAEDVNESIDTPWPDYDSPKNVGRPLYEERARNALLAAIGDNDE